MNQKSFEHVTDYITHGSCLSSAVFDFAYTPGKSASIYQTVEDLEDLARCALSVYRGTFPSEAPYQMWSAVTALPWMDNYFPMADMTLAPYSLESEIYVAAARLRITYAKGLPTWKIASIVLQHSPLTDVKRLVQELAVLTLFAVDNSVKSMFREDFPEAGQWHIWAHKLHTETVNISAALAHHSRTAKKGAAKRHEENRAMKAEVFKWLDCDLNQKISKDKKKINKDKTAEAIAGKVVPVGFRAVRGWIDDWQKQRPTSKV